jgi:hypothetical protein
MLKTYTDGIKKWHITDSMHVAAAVVPLGVSADHAALYPWGTVDKDTYPHTLMTGAGWERTQLKTESEPRWGPGIPHKLKKFGTESNCGWSQTQAKYGKAMQIHRNITKVLPCTFPLRSSCILPMLPSFTPTLIFRVFFVLGTSPLDPKTASFPL